jgi:hypothetical protein
MEEQQDVLTRLGGRKFVAYVLALLSLVLVAGLMPGGLTSELSAGVVGLVAVFSGANAMSTISAIKAGSKPAEAAVEPVVSNNEQLDRIENITNQNASATNKVLQVLTTIITTSPPR